MREKRRRADHILKSPPYIHVYPHLYSYPRNSHVVPTKLTHNPHMQLTHNSHITYTSASRSNPCNTVAGYGATECRCWMPILAILSCNAVVGLAGCRAVTALVQLTNVHTAHATEHDNFFPMNTHSKLNKTPQPSRLVPGVPAVPDQSSGHRAVSD